jgi:hypothetical protein
LSACIRSLDATTEEFALYMGPELLGAIESLKACLEDRLTKNVDIKKSIRIASLALIQQEAPEFHTSPWQDIMKHYIISHALNFYGGFVHPRQLPPVCAALQFCMRMYLLNDMAQELDEGKSLEV